MILDDFRGSAARPNQNPAVRFDNVSDATVRNCQAIDGIAVFLQVNGKNSSQIRLRSNDIGSAKVRQTKEVPRAAISRER